MELNYLRYPKPDEKRVHETDLTRKNSLEFRDPLKFSSGVSSLIKVSVFINEIQYEFKNGEPAPHPTPNSGLL